MSVVPFYSTRVGVGPIYMSPGGIKDLIISLPLANLFDKLTVFLLLSMMTNVNSRPKLTPGRLLSSIQPASDLCYQGLVVFVSKHDVLQFTLVTVIMQFNVLLCKLMKFSAKD